jgi:hypothetical protein
MALGKALGGGGGGGSVDVYEEGVLETASATKLNFTGAGVSATDDGAGGTDIDIPGGSAVMVQEQGSDVVAASTINVVGANLTVTDVAGVATVTETTFDIFDPAKPPAAANALDDEFPGAALDAKWTWTNQGTATATVANGWLLLTAPSNGGVAVSERILRQNAPATPWSIVTRIANHSLIDFGGGGLVIRDGGSGRQLDNRVLVNSSKYSMLATRRTNATTGSSDPFGANGLAFADCWLAMSYDGTTVRWYWSRNGVQFSNFYSETAATFLAPTGTVQVGIFADSVGTTPAPVGFEFFRVIASATPSTGGTRTITGS